jgi:processive 1,2-diacylglycerol beta-glucosyltransferase
MNITFDGGIFVKVLFLSNTAGQGHHSTANALQEVLTSRGVECRVIDTYAYLNPVLYETVARGYLMATAITPGAYGGFYRAAEKKDKSDSMYTPVNVANSVMAIKLKKYFEREFSPDVIVCTHVFSAEVVNVMKARGLLDVPVIGIITDYTIHPFWQDVSHIDYFVTASELLALQAVKKGIRKEQLLPFGIPISSKFSGHVEKLEARRQLGIDVDKQTVLLMSGSMGYGNISHVLSKIDAIEADFQIIAVCGNNRHAKRKIDRMETQKKVFCYGFVSNVELMMDASDCIVTKPGGLTTSEALAKNLPIIMVNPIPGQEERNVEFMLNNGIAINATSTFPVDEAIYQLFLYPEKLKNMIENIKLVGKPNAASDLCDFIINLNKNK